MANVCYMSRTVWRSRLKLHLTELNVLMQKIVTIENSFVCLYTLQLICYPSQKLFLILLNFDVKIVTME